MDNIEYCQRCGYALTSKHDERSCILAQELKDLITNLLAGRPDDAVAQSLRNYGHWMTNQLRDRAYEAK